MQQRLHIDATVPRGGQVKFDAEIVSRDVKRRRSKGRRVDALALVMQALAVGRALPPMRTGARPRRSFRSQA